MNNDLMNKALDQAKALQKTVGDAKSKSPEQAHPLIDEAVAKAANLKETLTHGASSATGGAKPHLEAALGHLSGFIATGKSALDTGITKARDQLEQLDDHAKRTIESTTEAMTQTIESAAQRRTPLQSELPIASTTDD